jgi:TetR/AcrR family transcriptional regulator
VARPPTDIRDRIVRAARARFLREGVDGASMRGIAKDARTSLGMITYYFASKEELFEAVFEDIYHKLLADLEACLGGDAPIRERLRATITRVTRATEVEVEVVRLVLREALVSSARREKIFDRFVRGHLPLVIGMLAEAQRTGVIDPSLPLPIAMVATGAIGILPHVARRVAGARPPFSSLPQGDVLTDLLLDTLFHGIAPRAAAPRAAAPRSAAKPATSKRPAKKRAPPKERAR